VRESLSDLHPPLHTSSTVPKKTLMAMCNDQD
jgi:hypothetical protein